LDFVVEHRAGPKIGYVYALSRHVGAAICEDILDRNSILREQAKDTFCTRQKPGDYSRKREFFLDDEGIFYKRQPQGKHELVVPKILVHHIIKENHDPFLYKEDIRSHFPQILVAWNVEVNRKYVKKYDPLQRRKEEREFVVPVVEVEEPTVPFEVTSMDVSSPYLLTPPKNRYLLTFIYHFTKYVEAIAIPEQKPETCARLYTTQMITRHGTGSKLVTDKGRAFKITFKKKTCKLLGIRQVNTATSYHRASNEMVER